MRPFKNILLLFVFIVLISILSACATDSINIKDNLTVGPEQLPTPSPPAPAVTEKYKYRYYPLYQVYFSIDWGKYYYLSNGIWNESYELPSTIIKDKKDYVTLYMDVEKP
jgi:hypothetical protein